MLISACSIVHFTTSAVKALSLSMSMVFVSYPSLLVKIVIRPLTTNCSSWYLKMIPEDTLRTRGLLWECMWNRWKAEAVLLNQFPTGLLFRCSGCGSSAVVVAGAPCRSVPTCYMSGSCLWKLVSWVLSYGRNIVVPCDTNSFGTRVSRRDVFMQCPDYILRSHLWDSCLLV